MTCAMMYDVFVHATRPKVILSAVVADPEVGEMGRVCRNCRGVFSGVLLVKLPVWQPMEEKAMYVAFGKKAR